MLFNPYRETLATLPGSRILAADVGVVGAQFPDYKIVERVWTVVGLYAPIKHRTLGGIRAKLMDGKGFITFCNQRDLELLLGLVKPGNMCPWTGEEYPDMDSNEFFGMCSDPEDLEDDLLDREMSLRTMMASSAEYPDVIPYGYQFVRRIHLNEGRDVEELDMMLYDCDPNTGMGPDTRFTTITKRWTRVERNRINWEIADAC